MSGPTDHSADLLELADRVVERARPGEQLEVVVGRDVTTEVRAYEGAIESLTSAASHGVGVRVIDEGRVGFASVGSHDPVLIDEALEAARDNASFSTPDDHVGVAEPDGVAPPDLQLADPALLELPTERKIELALELEDAVRSADDRVVGLESADYADGISEAAIVTTSGIREVGHETGASLVAFALASDGVETTTGFGWSVGRGASGLDPQSAGTDAARRAVRMIGSTKPASLRTTVVFTPYVTAQFLEILASTFSGESVLKGRSLFADRLGEQVAPAEVTLLDDPTDPTAFTATRMDGEGLACRRNVLLSDGVVNGFVHNSWSARHMGVASTGNAVRAGYASTPGVGCHAVRLVPGSLDHEAVLAQADDGVVVHEVIGLHSGVNPVSGDFSTGAEGRRLAGGRLGEPLREFTIASTLQKMLGQVVLVGGDVEALPMSATGVSLVVEDVSVSGA